MNKPTRGSKRSETKGHDIPSTRWYKNINAILVLAAALVGLAGGLIALMGHLKPGKVEQNTIILFDRSIAMDQPFDQGTKLEGAQGALAQAFQTEVANEDNLALRTFGGACDNNENTQMVVGFGQHNKDQVRNKVETLQAGGESTLTSAILAAIADFNDPERFAGVNKRIIIITGGADDCVPDPVKYIQSRLKTVKDIAISFRFIGMGLKPQELQELIAISNASGGLVEVINANSQKELEVALRNAVEGNPVIAFNSPTSIVVGVPVTGGLVTGTLTAVLPTEIPLRQDTNAALFDGDQGTTDAGLRVSCPTPLGYNVQGSVIFKPGTFDGKRTISLTCISKEDAQKFDSSVKATNPKGEIIGAIELESCPTRLKKSFTLKIPLFQPHPELGGQQIDAYANEGGPPPHTDKIPQATVSADGQTATLITDHCSNFLVYKPIPLFTFNDKIVNCRKGPSIAYEVVASPRQGQSWQIDGRNEDDPRWWWVLIPNTKEHCWISYVTGTTSGPVDKMQIVAAPPLPVTPLPNPVLKLHPTLNPSPISTIYVIP